MSIFAIVIVFFLACSALVLLGLRHSYKSYGKDIQDAEETASTYTNKEWTISRKLIFSDCSLLLLVKDSTGSECNIFYQPAHPDHQRIMMLPVGSNIQFLPEKNSSSEPTEPATYVAVRPRYTTHNDTAFHA